MSDTKKGVVECTDYSDHLMVMIKLV